MPASLLQQGHLGTHSPFSAHSGSPEQPSRSSSASPPEQVLLASSSQQSPEVPVVNPVDLQRQAAIVQQQKQQLEKLQRSLVKQAEVLSKLR